MNIRKLLRTIDNTSDWQGRIFGILPLALILILTGKVFTRYVLRLPDMYFYEIATMAGGVTLALGWAVATLHNRHIRIDLLYVRMPSRVQAAIDTLGGFFLAFPVIFLLTYTSVLTTVESWAVGEKGMETSWYPPLAPFRTLVTVGFFTFALQAIANFFRDLNKLLRGKQLD